MTLFRRLTARPIEVALLLLVIALFLLGFSMTAIAGQLNQQAEPLLVFPDVLRVPAMVAASLFVIHFLLLWRSGSQAQLLWPAVAVLVTIGMIMIFRLRGTAGVWQQFTRGWVPGVVLIAALLVFPRLLEWMRRAAIPISIGGLLLLIATAFFGVADETGARLALQIGPLPAVQTSEVIKLALIIFLAWYIEQVGEEAEGRARPVGWLRLPSFKYFIPGLVFVGVAALALVLMSDFGAILIIGSLFIAMLYAGFQPRVFGTIALIGLVLFTVLIIFLALFWSPPDVIRHRVVAFMDPWSEEPLIVNGQPSNITVAEGPGYQIQQAIYAVTAGGLTGTGLGFGTPYFVPLAHSDFIFAAIVEEFGGLVALAIFAFFAVLLLRLLRLGMMLPAGQVFERLLLVGIGVHLFMQLFVMAGGTLNLLPLTGITVPFLSQGGVALMVNLLEVGIGLTLAGRLK